MAISSCNANLGQQLNGTFLLTASQKSLMHIKDFFVLLSKRNYCYLSKVSLRENF